MHREAHAFVAARVAALKDPIDSVVDFGGRDINGTVRSLFGPVAYLSLDLQAGPGVDVVADAATYQPSRSPSLVVCCEVLEHTAQAPLICANAHRILPPGGVFLLTAAGKGRAPHSAVDGGPLRDGEFYHNVARGELWQWLSVFHPFVDITVNDASHDIYAMAIKR